MELIKSIETGKRYVQTLRDGSQRITKKPRTFSPPELKVIDEPPELSVGQEAVKLPVEKWKIAKEGIQVAYSVKSLAETKG